MNSRYLKPKTTAANNLQTTNHSLKLINGCLQITKLAFLFALDTLMTLGSSVGSWRFTLKALHGLMPILATYVEAPMECCCGTKLHWCIIPVELFNGNGNGYRSFTGTFVSLVSRGKCRTILFSHLHG